MTPITKKKDVMAGKTCFRGTRIPVEMLFQYLIAGETVEKFCYSYPSVSEDAAKMVLAMAMDWFRRME